MFSQEKELLMRDLGHLGTEQHALRHPYFKPFRDAQSITKNPKFGETQNFILLSAEKQVENAKVLLKPFI